jgi:peptide/nickel transport system permease protein
MTLQTDLQERRQRVRTRYGIAEAPALEPRRDAHLPLLEPAGATDPDMYYASQWQLMWWRFRRHRVALVSVGLLVLLYLMAIFANPVAPYEATARFRGYQGASPTQIHFIGEEGLQRPFIYGRERAIDPVTRRTTFVENREQKYPIRFWVPGTPYTLWGVFRMDRRLFGLDEEAAEAGIGIWLFGTDRLARDVFSRTIFGARISLSIGLISVVITFLLGTFLGGVSGYFGGVVDNVIQRIIEFLRAIPQLPLWMTLAAAVPKEWPPIQVYFAITLILALLNWVGLARVVRGRLLSMREEDYALAARASGTSDLRIIVVHLLPGFTSHLILVVTLMIPQMILYETALSFLGLGMQPPAVSWGVLLQDFRDILAIFHIPWLLIPAGWVLATVLLFNFVGDGLRDAADPYAT